MTGAPLGTSAEQFDPRVPHRMSPAPMTEPPVGFVMVSLNVTACGDAATGSNLAPHFRGSLIDMRPVGAQSPNQPLKT